MSEVVTQLDLQNHINRDYRQVHQGSWAQIKAYIDSTDTEVEEDQIDDEMTHDETWRDFTCVGRTGYIGQRYVILSVHCATETWADGLAWIQLHRDGETAGWRYYFHASGAIKSVVPDAAADYDSGEVTLPLTNGQFHYKSLEADGGVVTVKIVGYKNGTGAGDVSHNHQLIQVTDFPWVDCRAYASFSLAIDAIGATEAVLLISEQEAVTANKTVPANVTLKPLQGGTFNISAGVTVTINGHIEAGLYQIFEGAGTVVFGLGSVSEVYPEWWGAVPYVAASPVDCATALQAATDTGLPVIFSALYKSTATIDFDNVHNHVSYLGRSRVGRTDTVTHHNSGIYFTDDSIPGINIDFVAAPGHRRAMLKHIQIRGSTGVNANHSGIVIPEGKIGHLIVEDCDIRDWGGNCVLIQGGTGIIELRRNGYGGCPNDYAIMLSDSAIGNRPPPDVIVDGGYIQGTCAGAIAVDTAIIGASVHHSFTNLNIELIATATKPLIYLNNSYGVHLSSIYMLSSVATVTPNDAMIALDGVTLSTTLENITCVANGGLNNIYLGANVLGVNVIGGFYSNKDDMGAGLGYFIYNEATNCQATVLSPAFGTYTSGKNIVYNTATFFRGLVYRGTNLYLGQATKGDDLLSGIVVGKGTAPTTSPADSYQEWCADIAGTAGKAGKYFRNENTENLIAPGVLYKTDTGDPAYSFVGMICINYFDNNIKMYADGAWRTLATW